MASPRASASPGGASTPVWGVTTSGTPPTETAAAGTPAAAASISHTGVPSLSELRTARSVADGHRHHVGAVAREVDVLGDPEFACEPLEVRPLAAVSHDGEPRGGAELARMRHSPQQDVDPLDATSRPTKVRSSSFGCDAGLTAKPRPGIRTGHQERVEVEPDRDHLELGAFGHA